MKFRYLIKKKKLRIFILFFIFIIIFVSFVSLKLLFSASCIDTKVFRAIKDFDYSFTKTCISKENLAPNIKKILRNSPELYEFARKIKRKKIQGFNKDILTLDNSITDFKNLEKFKHVEGLLSKKNEGVKELNNDELLIENSTWTRSHGGNWNTHFSDSESINIKNIKNLKLLWKRQAIPDNKIKDKWQENIEVNPIVINKKLIYITPDYKIVALDALTGKKLWDLQSLFRPSRRGIVGYTDKNKEDFLFLPLFDEIFKVKADSGKLVNSFGDNGMVKSMTITAPMIYNDLLIVSSMKAIDGFDINTGEKKFRINNHFKERNFNGSTPWGGAALDKTKGLVFIVTGNPFPDLYGVNRPGDNKNSSSIIAFDLKNKKILWAFQDVSHDLWDLDVPSPPIIHNLKIDGKIFEVVIALTKSGNVLLLERNTGEPLYDLRYRKAPKSDVPNEVTSDYQLDLEKPEKFSKNEYGLNDFNQLPNKKVKEIEKLIIDSKFGWFEPPSFKKDLITFGLNGGAQWPGAALDPFSHELFIPTNNHPWKLTLKLNSMELHDGKFTKDKSALNLYYEKCSGCHKKNRNGEEILGFGGKRLKYIPSLVGLVGNKPWPVYGKNYFNEQFYKSHAKNLDLKNKDFNILKSLFAEWDKYLYEKKIIRVQGGWFPFLTSDNLPASNPPWGYIAKINLANGKLIWKKTIGKKLIDNKWVKAGSSIFGGVALNKNGILFVTGTDDNFVYALDSKTGEELWSYKMKASGSAPPTIFEINGKEYVTILSTGGQHYSYKNKDSTIYTFAINQ